MNNHCKKLPKFTRDDAWTLLEAALLMAISVVAVTGAFALVQYSWMLRSLDQVVDRFIYDNAAKPFELVSNDGHVVVRVKSDELTGTVENIADQAFAELDQVSPRGNNPTIFVQIAFAELQIDTANGRTRGLRHAPFTFQASRGDSGLPAAASASALLEQEFSKKSEENSISFYTADGKGSAFAIPTGAFGGSEQGMHFLPSAVLLGGRAAISLEDTFSGELLSMLGISPVVYSQKIVSLRGDVG